MVTFPASGFGIVLNDICEINVVVDLWPMSQAVLYRMSFILHNELNNFFALSNHTKSLNKESEMPFDYKYSFCEPDSVALLTHLFLTHLLVIQVLHHSVRARKIETAANQVVESGLA